MKRLVLALLWVLFAHQDSVLSSEVQEKYQFKGQCFANNAELRAAILQKFPKARMNLNKLYFEVPGSVLGHYDHIEFSKTSCPKEKGKFRIHILKAEDTMYTPPPEKPKVPPKGKIARFKPCLAGTTKPCFS